MRKLAFGIVLVAVVTLAGALSAKACEGEEVLYEDSFEFLDPGWGQSDFMTVEDEQLQLASTGIALYRAMRGYESHGDADICVNVTHVEGPDDLSAAGVIFWFSDVENYFLFEISPVGTWQVARLRKGKWNIVSPWAESLAINKGAGAVNKLRVLTQGNAATVFINDTEVAKLRGNLPKDGQSVGLAIEQISDAPVTVRFDDFSVTSVP